MAEQAKVNSLDALAHFRAAYADFGDHARLALINADSDIRRTVQWITVDAPRHWKMQIKKREKKLAEAKQELQAAELSSSDTRPSLVLERKRVQRAQAAVDEARHKMERVKYWSRILDREVMLYNGLTQGFSSIIERDVPKGIARLGLMMDRLQKYIKVAPPTEGVAPSIAQTDQEAEETEDDNTSKEAGS